MLCREQHQLLYSSAQHFEIRGLAEPGLHQLIDQAVKEAGRENKRACPLTPRLIVWLVIAMAMYRNISIVNVFGRLISLIQLKSPKLSRRVVSEEALYHARARLGARPLKLLLKKLRCRQDIVASFRGLRVFGIDGTHFKVPDTPKNRALFKSHKSQHGPGSFPQMVGVFLMELSNRRIFDACFMPCLQHEIKTMPYLVRNLGHGDLLLVDRGLSSRFTIGLCLQRGAHLLFRIKSNWKLLRISSLGIGDYLIKLPNRRGAPDIATLRLLEFRVGKSQNVVRLLTDLLDPVAYPRDELARLYHERWECEVGFREIKSEMLGQTGTKMQSHFRSKTPVGVLQEAWGLAVAHSLIKDQMESAATLVKKRPALLSFALCKDLILANLPRHQSASPTKVLEYRKSMLKEVGASLIDRPRRKRQFARVVKNRPLTFPMKRPSHRQMVLDDSISFVAA